MRFSNDQRGHELALIAFNGVIIGGVQWADTQTGELCRIDFDTGQPEILKGQVDFVGESTDPPELVAARLDAVRGYLLNKLMISGPLDEYERLHVQLQPENLVAYSMEVLARRIRENVVANAQVTQKQEHDAFPLPEGRTRYVSTGKFTMLVEYDSPSGMKAFEDEKTLWARENPELVPEYIRSKAEGAAAQKPED